MTNNPYIMPIMLVILLLMAFSAHAEPAISINGLEGRTFVKDGAVLNTATKGKSSAPTTPEVVSAANPANLPKSIPPVAVEVKTETKLLQGTSVLERFRTFSGQRTPEALSNLFVDHVLPDFRQQPEIALSNGSISININLILPVQDGAAPNFALKGARMLSYIQNQKNEWQIVALPETGAWKAELIVLSDSTVFELPLVVAPPLPMETDLSEQGFIRFLSEKDRNARLQQDLNADGRIDYLDDFIFTANYLARKGSVATTTDNSIQGPDIQNSRNVESANPPQGLGSDQSQAPQPVQNQNSNPHSLANRNERARQLNQLLRN